MTLTTYDFEKQNPYIVKVQTDMGSSTKHGNISLTHEQLITNEDFKASIESAITGSKIFRGVISGAEGGDYLLTVSITRISVPIMGFTATVDIEAVWVLTRVKDKKQVLKKAILSTGTATFSDAMAGVTRGRLAVEHAARENIRLGLEAVAAKDLQK
jgi:hypothetical protein